MKILKIEIQNINSLKSDTPIVIDFENEQFKDVGLYAITGSTGAGKTTVLDAITIALYHNVPRFNGNKGSLLNVVSHGANDAFSRITFENDNIIYEAFWSIRVADKKGKVYKNPKEEVGLKNLTSNKILATQKRDLITKVETVTRLDYHQFLRSMMLAQGEFASFLTAKGPDKGKLLEQITGEKVYKKIGESILERKASEEKKLEAIKAKINDTDVLDEEAKAELEQKDKTLDADILKTETDIQAMQIIVNWYAKSEELLKNTKSLEENSKNIDLYVDKHKAALQLLALNDKATPFKEIIQDFNRTEKNHLKKVEDLKILKNDLETLKPIIENLKKLTKEEESKLILSNNEFKNWLPRFDLITDLDGQLKNEITNGQKAKEELVLLNTQIDSLTKDENKLRENIQNTELAFNKASEFLTKNKFLKEVDTNISNWSRDLTILKANKKSLIEDVEFINKKNKTVDETTTLLNKNRDLLGQKTTEIKSIEKEYALISNQLEKNNIKTIIVEKDKLAIIENNWKSFKNISEQTLNTLKEQTSKSTKKEGFAIDLESLVKEIVQLKKQIEYQEKSVIDASKILDLEKSIAKYEDDRKNLIKGEACVLCGSTEHPFAENFKKGNVSDSELELQKRETILKTSIDKKNELEKKEVQLNTNIKGLTNQINEIDEELKNFKHTADLLKINYDLTDASTINTELNLATEHLNKLKTDLITAQNLEIKKDEIFKKINTQNTVINNLKTEVATLNEKLKITTKEIDIKQKTVNSLTTICADLESEISDELAKFNYKLPTDKETDTFIKTLENSISHYIKEQENANGLTSKATVFKTDLNHINKQLKSHQTSKKGILKVIDVAKVKVNQLKTDRIAILPITESVESKRNSLQLAINQLTNIFDLSEKELQKLTTIKTEKEALKEKSEKETTELQEALTTLETSIDSQIKNSDFESKKAIEKALLPNETVSAYQNTKERIKENQLKLKTLQEENLKEITTLNNSKNFETTDLESKTAFETLNNQKTIFSTEKGKISEAFRKDKEIRNRNKEVYKKIDIQDAICSVWRDLFKLIGNSKDAFNVYVQRLTLKHLLDLANVHLYKLNKRYSLKMEDDYKPKEELNFNLIDHYQTDQERLVDTSSGGEKFIISLALALGLSDLASKNVKIDSLFIDEGFGTLDKNTLETVISTLETLQSQGKTIGIISHVENLKERISRQIKITKKSNGVSEVAVL